MQERRTNETRVYGKIHVILLKLNPRSADFWSAGSSPQVRKASKNLNNRQSHEQLFILIRQIQEFMELLFDKFIYTRQIAILPKTDIDKFKVLHFEPEKAPYLR
jgi:hypothetical protein